MLVFLFQHSRAGDGKRFQCHLLQWKCWVERLYAKVLIFPEHRLMMGNWLRELALFDTMSPYCLCASWFEQFAYLYLKGKPWSYWNSSPVYLLIHRHSKAVGEATGCDMFIWFVTVESLNYFLSVKPYWRLRRYKQVSPWFLSHNCLEGGP
jgi:hypothetical protein